MSDDLKSVLSKASGKVAMVVYEDDCQFHVVLRAAEDGFAPLTYPDARALAWCFNHCVREVEKDDNRG